MPPQGKIVLKAPPPPGGKIALKAPADQIICDRKNYVVMPDITLVLKLALINLMGRGGVGNSESGEVSFSGDSFVNVLIMKSLIFLCLI